MTEAYVWREGSAYFYTGAGGQSALVAFARDVRLSMRRTWHAYRPPYSTTYVSTVLETVADLSIGQAYSQKPLMQMFESATAGVHVHLKHLLASPSQSAGFYLFSGRLAAVELAGSDPNLITLSIQGQFNVWSGY